MVQFQCQCGKQLQAREEYAGQLTQCPACGHRMNIPRPDGAIEAVQAAPARLEAVAAAPPAREWDDEDRQPPPASGTSGKAIVSLLLGFVFFCSFLTAIPAIVLGLMALGDIGRSGGRLSGRGMAITGIVLGSLVSLLSLVIVPVGLFLPAVQKVRESANRMSSQNSLKQLGLAMHNYHDTYGRFPPAVVYSEDGKPLYSWRVLVLPFVEEANLYSQFRLDEAWDSPHNRRFLTQMPRVFMDPSRPNPEPGTTTYVGLNAKGAIFYSNPRNGLEPLQPVPGQANRPRFAAKPMIRIANITDGTSNTFMIVEADQAVPWTAPVDLEFDIDGPLPRFSALHAGGFNALFADGSVRYFRKNELDDRTLRLFIQMNDGQPIPIR